MSKNPRPRRKPAPRKRRAAAAKPSPQQIAARVQTLRDVVAEHGGGPNIRLQADFLDGKGVAVLRVAVGDRVWRKVADGRWRPEDLRQLADEGTVIVLHGSPLGPVFTAV